MKQKHCFTPADILLPPEEEINKGTWAAIACDQFTSEPEYWAEAEAFVADAPSTLQLMLPEVYLAESAARLPRIHAAMREAAQSLLQCHKNSMIALRRVQSDGRVRKGLIGKIDLECYDYHKGANALIRATEGTVLSRIPPRVAIRRDAPLELPHVMLLIDDPDHTVIEPLFEENTLSAAQRVYDCPLMLGGGHATGYALTEGQIDTVQNALDRLITPEAMQRRYGDATLSPLLFAVGDGNHSLASAKATYEEVKAAIGAEAAAQHPARWALIEIVNLHDDALSFEPIYRVLFGADYDDVIAALRTYAASLDGSAESQTVRCIHGTKAEDVVFAHPMQQLTVGTLQTFLDEYVQAHPGAEVDYIHGEDSLATLAARDGAVGFLFDGMEKGQLFRTVIYDGALPRKTFSMGHARDKRYYMECRKIK